MFNRISRLISPGETELGKDEAQALADQFAGDINRNHHAQRGADHHAGKV